MKKNRTENRKRFAVFVLSHGRAKDIKTINALKKFGYTGDWFVVIDNEDNTDWLYKKKFGEHVIQFNKKEIADQTDTGDLDTDRRVGVFARNFIMEEADRLGYDYHLQLDDDFTGFTFRYVQNKKIASKRCTNLDELFEAFVDYLDKTNITWLSFCLSSDYLGGVNNAKYFGGVIPKTMGTFFMRANDKVKFCMRMNDDVTTCVLNAMRGKVFRSVTLVQTETPPTQAMKGGMTDIYQDNGTYRKSFYSVMACPSCVKIGVQGITEFRLHHIVNWNNCVPKILSERYKK